MECNTPAANNPVYQQKWLCEMDTREPTEELPTLLCEECGFEVRRTMLAIGDYRINGRLVVERKRIDDFAASLIDGRLFVQAYLLSTRTELPLIILEGSLTRLLELGVRWEVLQGAMLTIAFAHGVPIVHSPDVWHTARTLRMAANQVEEHPTARFKKRLTRNGGKRRKHLNVLASLPGVGPYRAQSVLTYFGTLRQAITAPPGQWTQVAGIGEKTAERIADLLDSKPD